MKVIQLNIDKVCVIGDIHSSPKELEFVISKANANGIDKFIFLGDLWDRGYDPNGVVDIINDLVVSEKATVIVGNHDNKFIRHFNGNKVNIAPQQQETLSKLTSASIDKFKNIFQEEIVAVFDPNAKIFMSHAAAGRPLNMLRHMLDDVNREYHSLNPITLADMFQNVTQINVAKKRVGNFMYGITNGDTINGLPVRMPITKSETDTLDDWLYVHGHTHSNNLFPEDGNKHVMCLDFSCGEPPHGKLCGMLVKDGMVSVENVIFSS